MKKIILFVGVLLVSYFTSVYSGMLYNNISLQHGGWLIGGNQAVSLAGFFISYIFLIPFVFGLCGIKRNKKLIAISLLPVVLLVIWSDTSTFYVPLLLVAAGLLLAFVVRSIVFKIKN